MLSLAILWVPYLSRNTLCTRRTIIARMLRKTRVSCAVTGNTRLLFSISARTHSSNLPEIFPFRPTDVANTTISCTSIYIYIRMCYVYRYCRRRSLCRRCVQKEPRDDRKRPNCGGAAVAATRRFPI